MANRADCTFDRIMVLTYFPRLISLDQQRVEAWERPDSDTLWAKVTSPENWREVQRKVKKHTPRMAKQGHQLKFPMSQYFTIISVQLWSVSPQEPVYSSFSRG